jgi:Transposase domain (DUF772)
LPPTGGHPFYQRLNQVLDAQGFDEFVEAQCAPFYAEKLGRPSLTPGMYFRLLLIGYFEGIDSERGIAWRTAERAAAHFGGRTLVSTRRVGLARLVDHKIGRDRFLGSEEVCALRSGCTAMSSQTNPADAIGHAVWPMCPMSLVTSYFSA